MASEAWLPHYTATLYRLQVRRIQEYAKFLTDVRGIILAWNAGIEQFFEY